MASVVCSANVAAKVAGGRPQAAGDQRHMARGAGGGAAGSRWRKARAKLVVQSMFKALWECALAARAARPRDLCVT